MRLTGILYKEFFRVHNIPYRYRGKYRKERKITFADMMEFKWDLEREEQNMLLLRHPYLTIEQSRGHMTEFKDEKHLNLITGWQENRNARFNKRITITDRLNYYMQNEPWE
ncbi:large ribosomal subunit protein mL63 [Lasioglossum baleicum]|uniref:large ribosomal subunit protein mL63 n=1 Tax=Lasioglossum baleicum TaxID=434251 RepID=UPI003FCC32A5